MIDPQFPNPPAGPFLADRITPMTRLEAAVSLQAAHTHVFGTAPSRRCLCVELAHSSLETGNYRAIHLDNWPNIKRGAGYTGPFTAFRCNEVLDGKLQWFDPYNPQTWFRANVSPDGDAQKSHAMGAEAYLRFIGTATRPGKPNRYAKAWGAFLIGDPSIAAEELGAAGFYTASRDAYRRGMVNLFNEYMIEMPAMIPDADHHHDPIVLQPTAGHSPMTDIDLRERIEQLQIPLTIDWQALAQDNLRAALDEDK